VVLRFGALVQLSVVLTLKRALLFFSFFLRRLQNHQEYLRWLASRKLYTAALLMQLPDPQGGLATDGSAPSLAPWLNALLVRLALNHLGTAAMAKGIIRKIHKKTAKVPKLSFLVRACYPECICQRPAHPG
jgi:hypothetical protein